MPQTNLYGIQVPDVAKSRLMKQLIDGGYPPIDGNSQLQFYQNYFKITKDTVLGNFTASACPGIGVYPLTGGVNTGPTPTDLDLWVWPELLAVAGPGSGYPYVIRGYWVTSTYDGALLWCQTFETPWEFWGVGDTFTGVPTFGGGQTGFMQYNVPLPEFSYLTADDDESLLFADDNHTLLNPG